MLTTCASDKRRACATVRPALVRSTITTPTRHIQVPKGRRARNSRFRSHEEQLTSTPPASPNSCSRSAAARSGSRCSDCPGGDKPGAGAIRAISDSWRSRSRDRSSAGTPAGALAQARRCASTASAAQAWGGCSRHAVGANPLAAPRCGTQPEHPRRRLRNLSKGRQRRPARFVASTDGKATFAGSVVCPGRAGPPRDTRLLRRGELADPRLRERACRCEVRPRGVARGELSIPSHENVDDARDVCSARVPE